MVANGEVIGEVVAAGDPANSVNDPANSVNDPSECFNSTDCTGTSILDQISAQLQRLDGRFDQLNRRLDGIDEFVLTFKKFMRMKQTMGDDNTMGGNEDEFVEFKEMTRFENEAELVQFELKLGEESYARKLKRYLKHQYELNGKKDSNALFKVLIRKFVAPSALLAFSWKGVSRSAKKEAATSQNKCFKTTFPNFVDLIDSVLAIGDCEYKSEFIDKYFDIFLRSKKKEIEREAVRSEKNVLPRKVASRTQKRALDEDNDDDVDEIMADDSTKRTKNDGEDENTA